MIDTKEVWGVITFQIRAFADEQLNLQSKNNKPEGSPQFLASGHTHYNVHIQIVSEAQNICKSPKYRDKSDFPFEIS